MKYEAKTYGNPEGDKVKDGYAQLKRGKSELVENKHWNDVRNLVIKERKRRGLDTSKVIKYIPPGEITAEQFMNLLSNANIDGMFDDSVSQGDIIKNENIGINDVVQRVMIAGQHCVCDCNYCSCDCDYCSCNCNYDCTCNCAY